MTEHDVITTDLAPSDAEAEQIKGGAPLVINLGPLGTIAIGIPGLGRRRHRRRSCRRPGARMRRHSGPCSSDRS